MVFIGLFFSCTANLPPRTTEHGVWVPWRQYVFNRTKFVTNPGEQLWLVAKVGANAFVFGTFDEVCVVHVPLDSFCLTLLLSVPLQFVGAPRLQGLQILTICRLLFGYSQPSWVELKKLIDQAIGMRALRAALCLSVFVVRLTHMHSERQSCAGLHWLRCQSA